MIRSPLVGSFAQPPIPGLLVPKHFYWLLAKPAPLAGMSYPLLSTAWAALSERGFRWVVCLTDDERLYDPAPLEFAACVELDDLAHGGQPDDPGRQERRIREVVRVVAAKLRAREGVVVHCQGGTGRTGTIVGCVLVALGHQPPLVIEHLQEIHRLRGKRGWPESPWQGDLIHRYTRSGRG